MRSACGSPRSTSGGGSSTAPPSARAAALPKYLTAASVVLALWVAVRSGEVWTGIVPATLIAALALTDYSLWERRSRPWHDWSVILVLLPAIFAAVWIGVGGLLLDVARTDSGRLVHEVGPGIGLVGLLCTLIAYHGRHRPFEGHPEAET